MSHPFTRRRFLHNGGLLGAGLAISGFARASATPLRIVSNPGLENATLNALMERQDYFRRFGVEVQNIEVPGVSGPFDAIAAGDADACFVSGYNLVLPRIAQGSPLRIVGAGMRKVALVVFAKPGTMRGLADLEGRTVAVGPRLGLLHTLMLRLLAEKGLDASTVKFVDKGGNDQCYDAVVQGEADACCSSVSHLDDTKALVPLAGGRLWQQLPGCVFQTAYASTVAIAQKHESLVAAMAAHGALYEYLMSPDARDAFFEARRRASKKFDPASAQAVWDFNQTQRPYSRDLSMTASDLDYLQDMDVALGSLKHRLPIDDLADMRAATEAARRFG
ncbi:ABC transporter substrate-binding protein [Scleromatobacter humisilvae]|uniref:ABC transporter substrate-binding protein n=1 Tax=Scleromatobacter humisilvae TaxID=2897159 RepID=A0A9X1YJ40_9BURK|nr:ABC transporter substrate-binding protein [Scleromatobacter humisilvae]MCK9685342.1 ABC transporter substrate-binding protein [Scleromatobacter humisilvae]